MILPSSYTTACVDIKAFNGIGGLIPMKAVVHKYLDFAVYLCRMVVSMLDMAGYKCIHSSVFMQDLIQKVFTQDPYSRTSYDIYRRLRIDHLDQSEACDIS